MLPAAFVFLKQLPLTANGKIDRQALPAPDRSRHDSDGAPASPRNQIEETLVRLWTTVLGVDRIGIHDNFFELGGDSILSIQIIARANQAGLRLSPRQLFQHQTIAELASVAGTEAQVAADQGLVTGAVPLLPVQARFFSQNQPAPHHYNQAQLLEVADSLAAEAIEQAVTQLLIHHDALRLRFTETPDGWEQSIAAPESSDSFVKIDLTTLAAAEQIEAFAQHAEELQSSLNLTAGPLLRAALFDFGKGRRLLLIVIHHLAVDGVSWSVLTEDLDSLLSRPAGKGELPAKTTSFKSWAQLLHSHANSEALRLEAKHWLSLSERACGRLPVDRAGDNTAASARTVTVKLDEAETLALLQEIPGVFRTQINEVLLAALARTLTRWTGSRRVLIDLEGHGREDIFPDVDLSRTVGWFTTIFPVVLDLSEAQEPVEALRQVKEQLRAIPGRGLGYGLLRYTCPDQQIRDSLAQLPQAEIRFNYLGQLDRARKESSFLFRPESANASPALSIGSLQSGLNSRGYLMNIIGSVTGGVLQLEWTYSENCHDRITVEELAANYLEELRILIAHSRRAGVQSLSPADFPSAGLSQDDLSKVLAQLSRTKP
jgi:non-ribosomal peptide synthase protein (TIGR01720 family)